MTTLTRTYNALRRITGPCAAYRIARAVRQFKQHMHSTATWAVAAALTLGVGTLAGHESTTAAQATPTTTTTTTISAAADTTNQP